MAENRSGRLPVPEGTLYWKYEASKIATSHPRLPLVFLHAAVANHALWDDQVEYLTTRGWDCLRYDLFGFNFSVPSKEFLESNPRPAVNHLEHLNVLLKTVLPTWPKVIIIGLSMGGGFSLEFTTTNPEAVAGLAVVAGGIRGFGLPDEPEENELFKKEEKLLENKDVAGLAKLQVRIWGDGPLQKPGRVAKQVSDKLYDWCYDIAARECANEGGTVFEEANSEPSALTQLHEIKIPTAIAYGTYDETNTTEAMKHLACNISSVTVKEFETAHMINLEKPDEFNAWLGAWLDKLFAS